jgi:hypothetical protein
VEPTACPAGTLLRGTAGKSAADCAACPAGSACPAAGQPPLQCAPGTFQDATGATACQPCPLGTYDASAVGRTAQCPACPAGAYCQSPTRQARCPINTRSSPGATSQLGCRCLTGFACSYSKRIAATVRLNATAANFNADVGGIRTAFINAVAAAAGVSPSQVIIGSVTQQRAARRLLSSSDHHAVVSILVEGSMSLDAIQHELALSTEWQPLHSVRARRAMLA